MVNLYSSPYDDAHEEVRNHAGNCHHQALDNSDARVKGKYEEQVVYESRVEVNHEVTNGPREERDQYEEWHCRECVADDECGNSVVTVHSLPLENLKMSGPSYTVQSHSH